MMKRAISVGFTALLMLSALVVLDIVPVMNVRANDPINMGGGLYITAGDWNVDATSTLKDFTAGETVVVNGHLTVKAPQTLTFTGANLQMNPSYDGEFRITVESGANIIIQDVDGNPATTADRSMVNSSNPAYRYEFVVEGPNGQITMTNSELRDCGWEENAANDWKSSGLWIGTDNLLDAAVITGNEIHEGVIGVTIFQSTIGADISDNDIHDLSYAGLSINQSNNVVVDNNVLTTLGSGTNSYAIHGWLGTNNEFTYNEIVDNQYYGMFLEAQSGITVDHNIIRDAPGLGAAMVLLGLSGDIYVTYNEIYNTTWHGMFVDTLNTGSNAYVNNNTVHDILITDGTVGIVQQNLELGHLESFDNVVYNIYESGSSADRNVGMTLLGGSGHVIARNEIWGVSDFGVQITADDTLFIDNDVYSNGDGDASVFGNDAGVIINADNVTVRDSRIYDNHPPFVPGSTDVNGIYIGHMPIFISSSSSSNILIENTEFDNNEINIMGYGDGVNSNDALFENCTITKGIWTNDNFDLDQDSDFVVLHPNPQTWDNSTNNIQDVGSSMTLKWYLNITVKRGGVPENGATVWVNATGTGLPDPSTGQPYTTSINDGDAGTVKWIPVTEYVETDTGKTDYTPHWVNASAAGSVGQAFPTVWQSKDIDIILNDLPEVLDLLPEGGATVVYRDASINIRANAQDTEDPEDMLTPTFEYRVSDGSAWEDTNFTAGPTYVGSAPSGYWEITFTPPITSPLGDYDFRAMVVDTYPAPSPWYPTNPDNNLLEVQNNPPTVVTTSNTSASVLRGNSIFVIADGDDVEDAENALACEIQYRSPSGSWSGPDSTINPPYFDGQDWRAQFTPRTSPTKDPKGDYDFQFRFQDTDGNWSAWETNDDWIEVLNNPPVADDISAGETFVYRNEQGGNSNYVWLFANYTEEEDPWDLMTAVFEYLEPGIAGWQSGYFDSLTNSYDTDAGLWRIKFEPPATATVGSYNFRVTFTDDDGDSDTVSGSGLLQVLNNIPTAIDITPSQDEIRAGSKDMRIQVNADDIEDDESLLTIAEIQYQNNGEFGGVRPGEAAWKSTASWFDASDYDPTGGGHLWIEFEPDEEATPGYYGLRVKVMDLEGDKSDPWLVLYDAVNVKSPKPEIEYVTPETDEVFRGEQLIIRMSGSDDVDPEEDLKPILEYTKKGTSAWQAISGIDPVYNAQGGYWEVYWTPPTTLVLGQYEFRGKFASSDEKYYSDYLAGSDDVTVKNNVPTADNIGIVGSATSVDREDTITLYANGDDAETPENQLTAYFEYSLPGDTWVSDYLTGKTYNDLLDRWEIDFEPEGDAELGDYSFRVKFKDTDNVESGYADMSGTITVNNVKPIVEDLTVPNSAFRGESITITANGADADGIEGALLPTFEYKSPSGSWTPIPGSANYVGTSFRISWTPGANEEVGKYSFRVKFSDGEDDSEPFEEIDAFELKNNEPEVDIDSPQRDGATVTFSATANDVEDPPTDLTYEWDFGDGDTSTEASPSHTYSKSGNYEVTLTITDSDGDTATDTTSITIAGDDTTGLDFITLLLLLIIIVVVVLLLLVLLMSKRKKKPEGAIPPAAPGMAPMAPGAPPPAAPMAGPVAGPEVAAPAAAPMAAPAAAAAPAAVPAAAPAAAPAAGGQTIKCPKCGTAFTEARTERPITIECPSCGAKGTLT